MFHNDDHTVEWKDDEFRTGEQIANFEWIFQPNFFKLDFGRGYEEALEYGDYQQLEALPGRNAAREGGSTLDAEAYITLAFINYLFYFSAHTLDRSGRRQWCLDRTFIDKSKIVTSAWRGASYGTGSGAAVGDYYAVNHELKGAHVYPKRSIFVREWLDPHWDTGGARTPLSPVTTHGVSSNDLWLQFPVTALDPMNTTSEFNVVGQTGPVARRLPNRCLYCKPKST